MFFWNSCFFHDPVDVGNVIFGSSAFSKSSLNIRELMVHVLLKPGLENFEHYMEIGGETVETVSDLIFLGLQNHCRW